MKVVALLLFPYLLLGGGITFTSYESAIGENGNHWIEVELEGERSNKTAIGVGMVGVAEEEYALLVSISSFFPPPREKLGKL